MHVKLTASALAAAVLLGAAAHSGAQQAAPTILAAVLADTSDVDADGAGMSPDTSTVDVRDSGSAVGEEDGGLSSPAFFELRLVTSRHSAVPTRMPVAEYRNLYIVDLRVGWTLTSNHLLSVEYAPSIVPFAISTRNPEEYVARTSVNCVQGKSCEDFTALDVSTVPRFSNTYGFGITPVGFQLRLFRTSPVQFLTYANGGALWFTQRIPDPEATRFNFTAELGAAVQVNLPERLGLVVGYSWHHTSNAGTGHVNPGLNSRALSVGVVARRGR
ncbi:MAG TPA: acyloxyacyl hydrolase [Gemmatimonadaceae bacterium]|nr:acyloxyacyl hydrolase [Gemmatimonadaceae bacterium]